MLTRQLSADDDEWDSLVIEFEHDTYHLRSYFEIEAARLGATPRAILVREADKALFIPVLMRRIWDGVELFDATSPYGYPSPLCSTAAQADADFVNRALVYALNELDVCSLFLRLHPLLQLPELSPSVGEELVHGETVWIDTSVGERMSWRGLRSSDKNRINKALRNGVTPYVDADWSGFDEFFKLYEATMDRLDAAESYYFDREYFMQLHAALGDSAPLCVVSYEERVIAAGMFMRCGPILQFHLSGSDTSVPHLAAARVMVDHMRRWATDQGVRAFHLGGGLGARKDSLFEFKAGFSPLRAEFRTWRLRGRDERYQGAVQEAESRRGATLAQPGHFFPPYRT